MSPVEMCGNDVVTGQPDALRALAGALPAEEHQPGARDHRCIMVDGNPPGEHVRRTSAYFRKPS